MLLEIGGGKPCLYLLLSLRYAVIRRLGIAQQVAEQADKVASGAHLHGAPLIGDIDQCSGQGVQRSFAVLQWPGNPSQLPDVSLDALRSAAVDGGLRITAQECTLPKPFCWLRSWARQLLAFGSFMMAVSLAVVMSCQLRVVYILYVRHHCGLQRVGQTTVCSTGSVQPHSELGGTRV